MRESQEQYRKEQAHKLEELKAVEERKKDLYKIATIDKINNFATSQAQKINSDYKSDMAYYQIPQYHCTNSTSNILPLASAVGGTRKKLKKKRKTKGRKKMMKKKTTKRRFT